MNICREESLEAGRRKFPRVSSVLGEGCEEGVALMVEIFDGAIVGEAVGSTLGDAEIPPPHAQHASFAVFPSVPV
jgi:hypothetical protein